jgi:hypothetical protein
MIGALLPQVTAILDRVGARYALIGAAALAAHGVARSTFDLDLLTTDPAVLEPSEWADLGGRQGVVVSVRTGDADDPLAGLVRIEAQDQRTIDVVVGRWSWQTDAVAAARIVDVGGMNIPVVGPVELVLLKLYAGGSQDLWDIEQLLAVAGGPSLVAEVSRCVECLPPQARRAWACVLEGR